MREEPTVRGTPHLPVPAGVEFVPDSAIAQLRTERSDDADAEGVGHGMRAGSQLQALRQTPEVVLDGAFGAIDFAGDLVGIQSVGHES